MKGKEFPVAFTLPQLRHLRRFLNRAVECAEGRCPGEMGGCWYYCQPLLVNIKAAIALAERTAQEAAEK